MVTTWLLAAISSYITVSVSAGCEVTPECFGHMTKLLSGLAGGKLVLALEGGYNVISIR